MGLTSSSQSKIERIPVLITIVFLYSPNSEELARRLQEVENAAVESGESPGAGPSQHTPQYPIGPRNTSRDKKVVEPIIVLNYKFLYF